MRDYGIDKGLIEFRDDSKRDQRGWGKGFFGFRKMFRDYLTKLNVAFYDTCCPAASPAGIAPLRYNDTTDTIEYFDSVTEAWVAVDAGALVSSSVSLDDGTVGALAVRIGADANNGLYGVSDTQLGIAVEGALVGGANTTGLFTGNISEQVAAAGVTVDGTLLKDGGITTVKADVTQLSTKTTTVVANGPSGVITTVALVDATDTQFSFTFTNSFIVATSVVLLTVNMNGGNGHAHVEITPGAGTSTITVTNVGTASFSSAIKIGYLVV